ncbi:hypothetical protein HU200_005185 [Digitaria exilis]|uniref:Cytochrome P450 n=1 Tax=Digitaria exilis TaxID=1010633 RepID=A0A835FR47_9POAL|nr:hypothetical protein HU200_005185 [Digitaria exilis]
MSFCKHHTGSPQAASILLLVIFPLTIILLIRRLAAPPLSRSDQLLSKLPSPPGRLPVIGHLHLVGSLPHIAIRDLAAKHGRDGLLLVHLGAVKAVIVSSPRAAQAITRTHDHIFASRRAQRRHRHPLLRLLGCGLHTLWKIATTHLLTAKRVRSYRHAPKIRQAAVTHTSIDMTELINNFSNDIISHAVSGKNFKEEGHNKLFGELTEANSTLLTGFNLEDVFPLLGKIGFVQRMLCAKAWKVNKRWDELLDKLIDGHASRPASERGGEDETDFIDVLLSIQEEYNLTREQIKAQLVVIFQAGTDTSYVALEYVFVELVRNPRVMAKLRAEVMSIVPKGREMVMEEDLNDMAYLKAVVKETLRYHIPAPFLIPHVSMADCEVEGYMIPAGTRVMLNVWALAMDPNVWEKPEEFMPERFMEGGSAAAMDFRGNDFSFLPFGSGRRMCAGINFAMPMIELMIANLVYHFNWELPPERAGKGIDMTAAVRPPPGPT